MNYVQLHLGDWIAATVTLTATERGVYMDLLVRYYKEERPLTEDECKRIARAYAPAEQEAMHYVLQQFFTRDGDAYRQSRCDEEIEKAKGVSEKRKRAAASRWGKKADSDASAYADAVQVDSTCSASGMLTSNQEPITNKEPVVEKPSDYCPTVDDYESEQVPEPVPEAAGVKRVKLFPFPDALPEEWATEAAKRRPDVSAEEVFFKLQVWLKDRQPSAKRTMAQWLRQYLQWITSERIVPSGRNDGTAQEHTDRLEKLFAELGR